MNLARRRGEGCLSDLRLDRLRAGELSGREGDGIRDHLGRCATCRTRADELLAEVDLPPLPRRARPRRAYALGVGGAVAAALIAVVAVGVGRDRDRLPPAVGTPAAGTARTPAGGTRLKGGARLGFYVRRGDALRPGGPGEAVHPGDGLQFTTTLPAPRTVAVLSVDGARQVSLYQPPTAQAPGEDQLLPGSVVLDATLGPETIYGLFCEHPIAVEPLLAALRADPSAAPAVDGCAIDVVHLEKREAP